jgi:DNA-binding transcriptional MerR regulator
MSKQSSERQVTPTSPIPDKLYFRIGEAARLCGVEAYVLRFWETEFSQLHPNKGGTGQRLYRRRDVELALHIKQLLHQEGYTIAGARQVLAQESRDGKRKTSPPEPAAVPPPAKAETPAAPAAIDAKLQQLRSELKDLLSLLSAEPTRAGHKPHAKAHTARRERQESANLFE